MSAASIEIIISVLLFAAAYLMRSAASRERAVVQGMSAGCAAVLGVLATVAGSSGRLVVVIAALGLLITVGALLFDATSGGRRAFRDRGQPFVGVVDTINAMALAYVAFVMLPWVLGTVPPSLALLGLAGGVVIGTVRLFVDRRWTSVAPALMAASAVVVVPIVWTWAAHLRPGSPYGWAAVGLCGLMLVALALAAAHRIAERRSPATR